MDQMEPAGIRPGPVGLAASLALGLLACLAARAESAPERSVRFEHLLPEDGLTSATVYSLLQDRSGFLWVGTEGGLNRYDGHGFESFRHDPDVATSLASDDISFMLQDGEGRLWLATWGGGLDRLDPVTESVEHFRADPTRRDRLQDDRVQHLLEDSRGVLWIGTFSGGLSRYDGAAPGTFNRTSAATGSASTGRRPSPGSIQAVGDQESCFSVGGQ